MNRYFAATLGSLHLLRRIAPCTVARRASGADTAVEGDPAVGGCGWFDSSHELSSGLLVTEHASPDAVAGDLPLGGWIELHLSGWRPQLQPAAGA